MLKRTLRNLYKEMKTFYFEEKNWKPWNNRDWLKFSIDFWQQFKFVVLKIIEIIEILQVLLNLRNSKLKLFSHKEKPNKTNFLVLKLFLFSKLLTIFLNILMLFEISKEIYCRQFSCNSFLSFWPENKLEVMTFGKHILLNCAIKCYVML